MYQWCTYKFVIVIHRGAKEQSLKEQNQATTQNNNLPPPSPAPSSPLAALNSTVKPHLHRIASLVKK